jgi:hypothetical protein
LQPDRIALMVVVSSRIVVPQIVVMQPCLPVEDLSGEAQVVGNYCGSNVSAPMDTLRLAFVNTKSTPNVT